MYSSMLIMVNSNDDNGWWILSLIKAYNVYGDSAYLTEAEALWDVIATTSVTVAADAGTSPNHGGIARNPIIANCDVAGAVYWERSADSQLNAISTGLFAQTGALLYEITRNTKYLDGSKNAIGWINRMILNPTTGILVQDRVSPTDCKQIPGALTYNTGVYIGANIVLARVTGDDTYMKAAVLSGTTASTTQYSGTDLLMTEEKGISSTGDSTNWRGKSHRHSPLSQTNSRY
jgi:predicted alpha-1,6-mannanase (GH76 family)